MNQAEMVAKWEEHIGYEFSARDVSWTIELSSKHELSRRHEIASTSSWDLF